MGKKLFSMLLCLVAYAGMAFAQNVTVTGTVTEASNGAPIPGATVMIDGTLNGTSTDANGKYSISVSSIGRLVFSVIGFETLTIPV
ncbi:MAG: carboxypeptidase-like regulatory domain-containing protein, partial [Bacteroidales bacterium]|nr:carboxypeptidase-like regulatory domain-containing protein [Bacteroidales bacterium]